MTTEDRRALIDRYAGGPALLFGALNRVPQEARFWRPAPGKWSVHEIVCHCADSETVASTRIRFLVGEDQPTLLGYDQDRWARRFDYHARPLDLAMRQIEQTRLWTAEMIRSLPDSAWSREGRHTESGHYPAGDWLRIYAEHLEVHSRQIERNISAFSARGKTDPRPASPS